MPVKLKARELSDGRRSYYLSIHHNGRRWEETISLYASRGNASRIKAQAEEIRTQRSLQLASEPHDLLPVFSRDLSFLDYFKKYAKNYKLGDGNAVRACAKKFEEWLDGDDITFKQLTRKVVKDFRNNLASLGLKGETAPNYLAKFKKVISQAREDGYITADITFKINISIKDCTPTAPKETLTIEEVLQLIKHSPTNVNVYKAFLFCCFTGLRTSEVRKFSPKDVEWIEGTPHIDIAQKKGVNPKPKLIPLNEYAFTLLGEFEEKSKHPFFKLPTQNGINVVIKAWLKKAGVKKHVTFYCARHTFGTQLMASGVDARTVAGLLGHSSLKYIIRYAREVDSNKIRAVKILNDALQPASAA